MRTPDEIVREFRTDVMRDRPSVNLNNWTRTDYYLEYWQRHAEVPWALLAHLVSRNAGWQMTDLARYVYLTDAGVLIVPAIGPNPHLLYRSILQLLEVANFLILEDVYPQLQAYERAKQHPEASDKLFDLLASEPQFGVDTFAVDQWKVFFAAAKASGNWFAGVPPDHPPLRTQSFALIINEQNQIEDRLVNDPTDHYLKSTASATNVALRAFGALGLTRLAFPEATSLANPAAQHLLIYEVSGFVLLDNRVQTGRNLFTGIFSEPQRQVLVPTWAKSVPFHHGTRQDYFADGYDVHISALLPGGRKYSPPLKEWDGVEPTWPEDPTKWIWSGHLHDPPVKLPHDVASRGSATVAGWLAPVTAPKPFTTSALTDYAEVLI